MKRHIDDYLGPSNIADEGQTRKHPHVLDQSDISLRAEVERLRATLEAAMRELDRAGIRREDYIGDTPLELYDRIQILVEERDEARAALNIHKGKP